MSEVKLCKDCKHSEVRGFWNHSSDYYCMRFARKDPVLGMGVVDDFSCMFMREDGSCGKDGSHWEDRD